MPPRSRSTGASNLSQTEQEMADAEAARIAAEAGEDPDGTALAQAPSNDDDEPDAEVTEDEDTDDDGVLDPDVYIVLTDLLMLKTGPKTMDTLRVHRGQLVKIKADHKYINLDTLLGLKALAPNDGKDKRRTTAKVLASAAGAMDDPVPVPKSMLVKDVSVTPADDPTVQPD